MKTRKRRGATKYRLKHFESASVIYGPDWPLKDERARVECPDFAERMLRRLNRR